jgi:hypothetical protein
LCIAIAIGGCNAVLGNADGDLAPDEVSGASSGLGGSSAGASTSASVASSSVTSSSGSGGDPGTGPTGGSSGGSGGTGGAEPDASFAEADAEAGPWVDGRSEGAAPERDVTSSDARAADGDRSDAVTRDATADILSVDAFRCTDTDACSMGYNCEKGTCVAATVSCTAHKSAYPTATDGVYWINPTGTPMRAYCDMKLLTELCTEVEGEHRGKTREGSGVAYTMRSILHARDGVCSVWAVRASADGMPVGMLSPEAGQTMSTCQALGFARDVALGACDFGDIAGYSNCGFAVSPLYQWGNRCSGCVLNDGVYPTYVKQGPMHSSSVISSVDGSFQSRCAIK